MKKNLLLSLILSITLFSCNNKEKTNTESAPVEQEISDADRLNGKLVNTENGEWFVVKDGERWKVLSEQASTDYLKSVENGEENVVKNVPLSVIEQFPIVGEILPNAEFKSITEAELLEGKVISAENGEWYIIKEGKRWIPVSEEATNNYLKSIENGQENVVRNVSLDVLAQFPISGKLFPKLKFEEETNNKTAQ